MNENKSVSEEMIEEIENDASMGLDEIDILWETAATRDDQIILFRD